jgi:putative flippase GtrA
MSAMDPLHDEGGATPSTPRRPGLLGLLGRHQIASLISTAVDFGVMALAVQLIGVPAVPATVLGAGSGAITNFTLGRHWVYAAGDDQAAPQVARYAVISAASAGLNALGEYALHDRLRLHYLLARAIVAVAVSLLWNFPMQRYFVFRSTSKGGA